MFWDKNNETLDRGSLEKLQLSLLQQTVERAQQAPFYADVFSKNGIMAAGIKSLDDLRRIPFITKDDLREHYPYGFLAVSRDKIVRLHSSSGTSGSPTVIFHTMQDIRQWSELIARCMYMTGVRESDVFQNMTGYGLFTGGLGFHYGAEQLGAMVIPVGAGNTKRQIMLMREFETSVIHIIPSYALHFIKSLQEAGVDPKREFKLRIAYLGAEPHSDETRLRVEAALGVQAFNSYGLSEMNGPGVAFECPEQNGMHIWEDSFLAEIVDPRTLEVLPAGSEGELVLTTITKEGFPLVRYRTGDLCAVNAEPCGCGRTLARMSRIRGRIDDMIIMGALKVFPSQIEQVILDVKGLQPHYEIIVDRIAGIDSLEVRVEISEDMPGLDEMKKLEQFRSRIAQGLASLLDLPAKVTLVEPRSMPRSEGGKSRRVVDKRQI